MSSSCQTVVDEVARCIRSSPCMLSQGRDFHECLKVPEAVPFPPTLHLDSRVPSLQAPEKDITPACVQMRNLYFECKRAQLDMRKRFRGNPSYVE